MSYDLYFRSVDPPSVEAMRAWFAARPHYEVTEGQAAYNNPTTGVYWTFDFRDASAEEDAPVAFSLNYVRPSSFGLEAEPELTAFVEAFGLSVSDPQSDGMGDGPYSPEGFLRGWNAGNRFGYRAVLSLHSSSRFTLPTATNTGVWRWNHAHDAYTELLCSVELVCGFVPTIFLLVRDEDPRVYTGVVWGEGIPIALPEVDLVLAANDTTAAARVLKFDDLRPLLAEVPARDADFAFSLDGRRWRPGLRHWLVDPVPAALRAGLAMEGRPWRLRRVAADLVLDAERVAEVRPTGG